jgi:hypothetical protein
VPGNVTRYEGQFVPIPELRAANADVGLVFLSANDILYEAPTNDDMYAARTPIRASMGMRGAIVTRPFYIRDEPTRVLGCTSRYQFCRAATSAGGSGASARTDTPAAANGSDDSDGNNNNNGCTPLVGLASALQQGKTLWRRNRRQARHFEWATAALAADPMRVSTVPQWLGPAALTALSFMGYGLQGPLPDDQWHREVEFWFTTSLAHLQHAVLETATGPLDRKLSSLLVRPQTAEEHPLCRSQVHLMFFMDVNGFPPLPPPQMLPSPPPSF